MEEKEGRSGKKETERAQDFTNKCSKLCSCLSDVVLNTDPGSRVQQQLNHLCMACRHTDKQLTTPETTQTEQLQYTQPTFTMLKYKQPNVTMAMINSSSSIYILEGYAALKFKYILWNNWPPHTVLFSVYIVLQRWRGTCGRQTDGRLRVLTCNSSEHQDCVLQRREA